MKKFAYILLLVLSFDGFSQSLKKLEKKLDRIMTSDFVAIKVTVHHVGSVEDTKSFKYKQYTNGDYKYLEVDSIQKYIFNDTIVEINNTSKEIIVSKLYSPVQLLKKLKSDSVSWYKKEDSLLVTGYVNQLKIFQIVSYKKEIKSIVNYSNSSFVQLDFIDWKRRYYIEKKNSEDFFKNRAGRLVPIGRYLNYKVKNVY